VEEREQKEKKPYEKPKVSRVTLDAKCAVLGFCKGAGVGGPVITGCQTGFENCQSQGS
jgi:hypothetical protein